MCLIEMYITPNIDIIIIIIIIPTTTTIIIIIIISLCCTTHLVPRPNFHLSADRGESCYSQFRGGV